MSSSLSSFLSVLEQAPDAALIFHADGVSIRPDYHVTEIKQARVRAVDCGRVASAWTETIIQLLDGPAKSRDEAGFMTAEKFAGIARAGLDELPATVDGELYFEFAPGNAAMRKLNVHSVERTTNGWVVQLGALGAMCKPAVRKPGGTNDTKVGCCGSAAGSGSDVGVCCAG